MTPCTELTKVMLSVPTTRNDDQQESFGLGYWLLRVLTRQELINGACSHAVSAGSQKIQQLSCQPHSFFSSQSFD